jgi:hypothetical protein
MEQAIEFGMRPFVDDRHFCIDCALHKPNAYMGKCNAGKIQYPKILNRCNMYAEKVLQPIETVEDKPFWEI